MDTLFFLKDSTVVVFRKAASTCQPCVNEAGTSLLDVAVVAIICLALAAVAICAIMRYFKFKDTERMTSSDLQKEKENRESMIREAKVKAERNEQLLKRQSDLQDKLLNYVKEHAGENGFADAYTAELRKAIEDTKNALEKTLG